MFIGGAAILVLVVAATTIAIVGPGTWRQKLASDRLVIGLGLIFPIVVLSVLLFYGFAVMRAGMVAPDGAGASAAPLKISVVGHRWWWRVIYHHADGTSTETANELRIPVDRRVELALTSADVLHSFWVPAYAGKVDMVPGRTNHLQFTAAAPGLVRGQCAEYCGGAHALMAFYVVALPAAVFERWLANERADAAQSEASATQRGRVLFMSSGCSGCHTIRGTSASGRIGPDLTHLGSRHSLGAGVLPNHRDALIRWLGEHQTIKPDNLMPPYDFLSDPERRALARFLEALQ
jgi:cytochrome c oxidase subunit 2